MTADAVPAPATGRRGSATLGVLQRIGRSLMMPIAVLPVAGLLLRFGQPDVATEIFQAPADNPVSKVLAAAGDAIFSNLALLFAVGVAIGFARRSDGSTALSAVVGFLVFDTVYNVVAGYYLVNERVVNMGVLGGILVGLTHRAAVAAVPPDQAAGLSGVLRRATVRAHHHRSGRPR